MPEWMIGALAALGGALGAWAAIRVELRFVWRDLARVERRVGKLENGDTIPRRRWSDAPPTSSRIRRDS